MNYTVSDIARIVCGTGGTSGEVGPLKYPGVVIHQLLIDSRSRQTADPGDILFFAVKGERNNGHKYITELFDKGLRNFVVSETPPALDANFIRVKDTVEALQLLAAHHRGRFAIPVIGITGSNGKTIVKEWLHALLSPEKKIVRSPKSYNSQVGVPLSVWQMNETDELAIFEAGISKPGEMERLEKIIRPSVGIFTTIGGAHEANFENRSQKIQEKLKLFRNSGTLFYCNDYDEIAREIQNAVDREKTRIITWARAGEAELKIHSVTKYSGRSEIRGTYAGEKAEIALAIPFTDDASIENAIHCWLVMLYYGYKLEEINARMQSLHPVAMRLEQKEGINHCTVINDSYNSDIASLAIALDFLNQQNQHSKKTLILSDILQSGKEEEKLYAEVAELVNNKGIDRVIGIGKAISLQFTQFEVPEKKFFFNTESFLEEFGNFSFNNEAVLLKGARLFGFERISSLLQKKSHETVMEIHLNALVHNLNYFRSRLKPSVKVMAMVKAFSYGSASGGFEIANVLQFHKVDYLAVAYTDEGVELRNAGIILPIMVMNPEPESFDSLLKYRLEPEIYSFRLLEQLSDFLHKAGMTDPLPVHLKIDTGMHRLGFSPDQVEELILRLKKEQNFIARSVFSHLAACDDPQHDDFTRWQIAQFNEAGKRILAAFSTGEPIMSHIVNSSGALRFPDAQMDMVRLGIGLYGIAPDPGTQRELQNVAVLKTTISQIKKIEKGESIGYSRGAFSEKGSVIATVPIGYADGYSRRLGNGRGKMLVMDYGKNRRVPVPVIGNICMDMCMLDITGIEAREGDEVIVFGNEYSLSEIACDAGTIPYEILTGISRRVKRVYFQE